MPVAHSRPLTLLGAFLTAIGVSAGCYPYDTYDCGAYAYGYRGSCYCDDGYDGDPYEGCSPIMSWRLTDACDDQGDIAWKLFSQGAAYFPVPGEKPVSRKPSSVAVPWPLT